MERFGEILKKSDGQDWVIGWICGVRSFRFPG